MKIALNPVLQKEYKVRMRGWKAAALIGVYILVMMAVGLFMLKISSLNRMNATILPQDLIIVYVFLATIQFGLISLVSPSLTSGAISGEREKQTLEILLSTRLRCSSIILGKLFASLSQMILLIITTLPIFSIIFFYGGIRIHELLQLFVFYIILAITVGSIGIFFSTLVKKTTASTVLSYAVIIFIYLGFLFIDVVYMLLVVKNSGYNKTFLLNYFNPLMGFISLMTSQFGQNGSIMPGVNLSKNGLPLWMINSIINLCFSAVLIYLSSWRLSPVRGRLFPRRSPKEPEIIDNTKED